jgi:hypothetical protein
MEYILEHALAAILDHGGLTILALPRLLSDDAFRERVTAKVKDPIVRAFWQDEYARYVRRFRIEAIAPIQNKIGRLLSNPRAEHQGPSQKPLRRGVPLGPEADHDRQSLKRSDRRRPCPAPRRPPPLAVPVGGDAAGGIAGFIPHPFYLYIDEFQSFATTP